MAHLVVQPARRPLGGSVPVPSDKSISHRALICAALGHGRSEIRGFSYGEDNVATLNAFRPLGVVIEDDQHGTLRVHGVGLAGLCGAGARLDCGNSGTSMRLLVGRARGAALPHSRLIGDASLSRPADGTHRQAALRRGARSIEARPHPSARATSPRRSTIGPARGRRASTAVEYQLPVASAQVKSALLLVGSVGGGADARSRAARESRPHRAHARRARHSRRDGGTAGSSSIRRRIRSHPSVFRRSPGRSVGRGISRSWRGLIVERQSRHDAGHRDESHPHRHLRRSCAGSAATSDKARGASRLGEPYAELTVTHGGLCGARASAASSRCARSTRSRSSRRSLRARSGTTEISRHRGASREGERSHRADRASCSAPSASMPKSARPGFAVQGDPEQTLRAATSSSTAIIASR